MWEMLTGAGGWRWLIAGLVLMGLETLAPGVFLFWLGLAAVLTGLVGFAVALVWQWQLLLFAVFALAALPLWRRLGRPRQDATDQPFLNRRSEALVGRVFTLERPIVDGSGTVRIDDTLWRVAGPDAPAGSRVRITAADGAQLRVETEI
jgi:membrane protein implicated in regulation of membrane protease activity